MTDSGGDPACWLDQTCPQCDAVRRQGDDTCWRCGRQVETGQRSPSTGGGGGGGDR